MDISAPSLVRYVKTRKKAAKATKENELEQKSSLSLIMPIHFDCKNQRIDDPLLQADETSSHVGNVGRYHSTNQSLRRPCALGARTHEKPLELLSLSFGL